MREGKLVFNEVTGKYEFCNDDVKLPLSCGDLITVWDGEEWLDCRVEHNPNWSTGYYLIVLDDRGYDIGSIPLYNKEKARMKNAI